jgi:competence protein ComEC
MTKRERAFPRPTLVLLCGLVVGMFAARFSESESAMAGLGLLVVAVLFHAALRQADMSRGLLLALGFAGLGWMLTAPINQVANASRRAVAALELHGSGLVVIEGHLQGDPVPGGSGVSFWLQPGSTVTRDQLSVRMPGSVLVRVPGGYAARSRLRTVASGDEIIATGHMVPLPDEPEPGRYERYLSEQQAAFVLRARQWDATAPGRRSAWNTFRLAMRRAGDAMQAGYHQSLSPVSASLISGMSIGRTGGIPPREREAFVETGLRHLFAVSGLHAGLVGIMLMFIASAMRVGPRWRCAIVLVGLFLFCTLVGFRTASVRASLLMAVFSIEPLMGRPVDKLGTLATVALGMLIAWPFILWQLDFQLSFLCALVLVVCDPPGAQIERWVHARLKGRWLLSGIAGTLLRIFFISTCIQAALAPLLFAYFGEVSVIAPIANALVLPLMMLVMALAFLGSIMTAVWDMPGHLVLSLLEWPLQFIALVARCLGEVPFASLQGKPWPVWVGLLYYAAMLSTRWISIRPRMHRLEGAYSGAMACTIAMLVILWSPFFTPRGPLLSVTFIDAGQGDAVLVRVHGGAAMLVDSGPPGRGTHVVSRIVASGVEQLDYLVLTHADADHIGGAAVVVGDLAPSRILVGGSLAKTEVWNALEYSVEFHDSPVTTIRRGARLDLGRGVIAEVLHPTDDFIRGDTARNDASIVLHIRARDVSFLLTGDAESDAEASMLEHVDPQSLRATVLQAGHHGSRSSTSMRFLATVSPLHAVMSCGRDNRYGHPHPAVLARLGEMGVRPWRTDLNGEIHFATDGRGLWVEVERNPTVADPKVALPGASSP